MKTGRTLMELAQEIERQKETKLDLLDATPSIEMRLTGATPPPDDGPGEVSLVVGTNGDRRSFGIRPHAHQQIAAGLEIPRAYYERMLAQQPDLLAVNVNRWLHAEPVTRMVRTLDGDVRAWLSNRYRPLDNESVIEFLGPIFDKHGAGLEVKTCEITERRLYLKVSYPLVQGEVAKGDIVQSGFVVTNSEVGAGALSVYPWVLRLVCLNGMKVESAGQRRNHIGRRQEIEAGGAVIEYRDDTQAASDKAIMLRLRDTVEAVLSPASFNRLLDEFRAADRSIEIQQPEKAVEVLGKQIALTDAERGSVLRHLIRGGSLTAWGMANAVTRAAEDAADYDRATEIERAGYAVVEMVQGDGRAWAAVAQAA